MMRLKRINESPPGGFAVVYKKPGFPDFKAHGWSLNAVGAQLYQEQIRRGEKASLERARATVEAYTCNELLKINGWEHFVEITSEWRAEDYMPMDTERELSSPSSQGVLFAVVFPFCCKDGAGALKLMKWIAELTPPSQHLLVLSHDYQTPPGIVEAIQNAASGPFRSIKTLSYSAPQPGQWPPTVAFKAAAFYMEKVGTPWLWMEPDAVPIASNWLEKLQQVYWDCGKAFAGPIVPLMGHMNGTGIYPQNTPKRIPNAFNHERTAWDVTMKREMIHDCFDMFPTYFHAWTSDGNGFHPYNGGNVPSFPRGSNLINQIPKESVIFHRNKDLTLIERIKESREPVHA